MKKKTLLLALCLLAAVGMIKAADWVDSDVFISKIDPTDADFRLTAFALNGWDADTKGLYIDKTKFSSIEKGNAILLYFCNIRSDAKFYIGGFNPSNHYPGSDLRVVPEPSGNEKSRQIKIYVTEDMIDALKTGDFRLYGQNMEINRVDIYRGKAHVEGALHMGKTIWTGYFWIDALNTLEVYKESFTHNSLNLNDFKAIRFYHEAGRMTIPMNIFIDDWGDTHKLADAGSMTKTNTYYELELTSEIRTKLAEMNSHLKVQCGNGEGAAFNFSDIVLIPNDPCPNCFYYTY